jgi:hypothetical protein
MKITVTESVTRDIELPKYFKCKSTKDSYYMILDDQSLLYVKDYNEPSLGLFPEIRQEKISYHSAILSAYGFEPISETEFKNAFLKVSLELEKLAN